MISTSAVSSEFTWKHFSFYSIRWQKDIKWALLILWHSSHYSTTWNWLNVFTWMQRLEVEPKQLQKTNFYYPHKEWVKLHRLKLIFSINWPVCLTKRGEFSVILHYTFSCSLKEHFSIRKYINLKFRIFSVLSKNVKKKKLVEVKWYI